MDEKIIELQGTRPGPACPAYHRHKNREHCQKTKCRYYQNHRVTPVIGGDAAGGIPDFDENLDAKSAKEVKIGFGKKEFFRIHEECDWHCVKYDEPSKYVDLPWEMA